MTSRYLSAAYSRRKAPKSYDPAYLDVELARLARTMPTYVVRRPLATTQLQVDDGMLVCDATAGAFNIVLGSPTLSSGRPITIKKSDATANAITLVGTIDGVANRQLLNQNDSVVIQSDGDVWFRPMLTAKATSTTTFPLTIGTHLTGGSFDGSAPVTIATDGTSTNTPSTLVARDSAGAAYLTLSTAAQPNITSVGTLTSLAVVGSFAASVNLLEYTQQFEASVWGSNNSPVVTANTSTAPDGTLTADTLNATTPGGQLFQVFTPPSVAQVTYSIHIQRLTTLNQTNFGIYDVTAGTTVVETAALWTGNNVTSMATVMGGGGSYTFTSPATGWWRVSGLTAASLDPTHTYTFFIYARSSGNTGSIYVWGAQVQTGALTAYTANTAISTAVAITGKMAVTGNTALMGTLSVSGATTLSSTLAVTGNLTVNTNKFAVTASSGDTAIAGKVGVNNATVSSSTAWITTAGTVAVSSARIPPGVAPTSPVSGDVWSDTKGLYYRANTTTVGPMIDALFPLMLMGA